MHLITTAMTVAIGTVALPTFAVDSYVENQKIVPTQGSSEEYFGGSISLKDGYLVSAASRDNTEGFDAGAVYFFEQSLSGEWEESQFITAPDGSGADRLGFAVAIGESGGVYYLFASAPFDDNANGQDAGSVYVYALDDSFQWQLEGTLIANDGAANDLFGVSLAVDSDQLLVGAEGCNGSTGAAYIFELDGKNGWEQAFKLEPDDGGFFDYYSRDLDLSDDLIVIGSPSHDIQGSQNGAAYVYEKTSLITGGESWQLKDKLSDSNGSSGDRFGRAISISGDSSILIGANSRDSDGKSDSGAVFAYRKSGQGDWSLNQIIIPSDSDAGDGFGGYIKSDDTTTLIAARGKDDNGEDSGISYVLTDVNDNWVVVSRLEPSDATSDDLFGRPAIDGNQVIIGNEYDDINGTNSGAAYYYELNTLCYRGDLDGTVANEQYGRSIANIGDIDGDGYDDLLVGSPLSDSNGADAGAAKVISGQCSETLWDFLGKNAGDQAGGAVGCAGDYNSDGTNDFLIGAPRYDQTGKEDCGGVYVISGTDFSTLKTILGKKAGDRFGSSLSGGLDLTDDGVDDFAVGAPYSTSKKGKVYVIQGGDGSIAKVLKGENSGDRFGQAVAVAKKLDSSGPSDLLVGAPYNDEIESKGGAVYAFKGGSFDEIYTIYGTVKKAQLGATIAWAGKVDSDSKDDFVVGSPRYDHPSNSNKKKLGLISMFSGKNGELMWSMRGSKADERLGSSLAGNGDFNCDGIFDVVAGSPRYTKNSTKQGKTYIRSGIDGSGIKSFAPAQEKAESGFAVAFLDTDVGLSYVLSNARKYSTEAINNAGRIYRLTPFGCEDRSASVELDSLVAADEPGDKRPTTRQNLDLDGDGTVAAQDFIKMISEWGSDTAATDINGDGIVDHQDLTIFLIGF